MQRTPEAVRRLGPGANRLWGHVEKATAVELQQRSAEAGASCHSAAMEETKMLDLRLTLVARGEAVVAAVLSRA